MAKINHFYRNERVYEECCDRGVTFNEWITTQVEHYCCSECGSEIDKDSVFCSKCGVKFSGITEEYKTTSCHVCKTKFKQLNHENNNCCPRCETLINNNRYCKEDLAKEFFELGKKISRERKTL